MSVALDPGRNLYNGAPGTLLAWIDALDLREGDRVFHIGGGAGYYTAILARTVGPAGRVVMAEVDETLGNRARQLLSDLDNVEVIAGDGGLHDPGVCDAILVNAGATHPAPLWLDRLAPGGRLLVPLTFEFPNSHLGKGALLKIARQGSGFAAAFLAGAAPVIVYSCVGVRSPELNERLLTAYTTEAQRLGEVRSLRRDSHAPDDACWVHAEALCLSTAAHNSFSHG